MEALATDAVTATASHWQVATACDIRLGEYFGPGAPYEGYSIEISPDAVTASLEQIKPFDADRPQDILYEAAHIDTLVREHQPAQGHVILGDADQLDSEAFRVRVGIAGKNSALLDMGRMSFDEYKAGIGVLVAQILSASHAADKVEEMVDSLKDDTVRRLFGILATEQTAREHGVHEFQHVINMIDPNISEAKRKHHLKYLAYNLGGLALVTSAALTSSRPLLEHAPQHPLVASVLGVALGALAWAGHTKIGKLLRHRKYTTDPDECSARGTQTNHANYPQVISFQPIS